MLCADCRTELSASRLSCPACHGLVHRDELRDLASQAATARREGNRTAEIVTWRRALELLPPRSEQYQAIADRVGELTETSDGAESRPATSWKWAGLGSLGLIAWKLKSVLAFVATKGKLLLAGLTKSSTLFTMIASLGAYWAAFGWAFALGLVVSLYVHEMGHVAALRRLGIAASAPMFVPGLGAVVRMEQYPVNAREDARVGLAGPLWGLGAALVACGVFALTGEPIWGAIARVGAWINLFNLLPVWQLDGGRGFRALSRKEAFGVSGLIAALWFWVGEGLLLLLLALALWRSWRTDGERAGDRVALVQLVVLLAALSALTTIDVPLS